MSQSALKISAETETSAMTSEATFTFHELERWVPMRKFLADYRNAYGSIWWIRESVLNDSTDPHTRKCLLDIITMGIPKVEEYFCIYALNGVENGIKWKQAWEKLTENQRNEALRLFNTYLPEKDAELRLAINALNVQSVAANRAISEMDVPTDPNIPLDVKSRENFQILASFFIEARDKLKSIEEKLSAAEQKKIASQILALVETRNNEMAERAATK